MMMMLVVSVNPVTAVVVRPPSVVISAVIWIAPVIAVIPWVAVITVTVGRVTESDTDGHLSVSLFRRNQSQSDCYQWK